MLRETILKASQRILDDAPVLRSYIDGQAQPGKGQSKRAVTGCKNETVSFLPSADEGQGPFADAGLPELPVEGHCRRADAGQTGIADGGQRDLQGEVQMRTADSGPLYRDDALHSEGDEAGQKFVVRLDQALTASLAPTIAAIRYQHRTRIFAMEQRKRANLSLGAFLRSALGWSRTLPDAERKRIADAARDLIKLGEIEAKGNPAIETEPASLKPYGLWRGIILAAILARDPFDKVEKAATKEMERRAASLPVWPAFGEGVRGFSARGLGTIVGEAGDLSAYPKKGHLWKRMGVAVIGAGDGKNDVRQGGLRKGASAEDWIKHGYSDVRRSRMFVIGDSLVKTAGPYREVYLARKETERAKAAAKGLTVCPAAKIPKGRAAEFMSDGHVHKRAQRYMEKRLLRDLWQAWRRAGESLPEMVTPAMPAVKTLEEI